MRRKNGVGLGTVLIVVALVVTLGFALAGASVQHLNVQSRLTNSARALDVARAAVNLGLERVLASSDYGQDPAADTLQEYIDSEGAVGRMTFNPGQASRLGIPVSLNNLTGTEVEQGSTGQVVPLKTVHLVAVGSFRNVQRRVEVVLSLPPYPYAAASDGPISARQVIVGAVPPNSTQAIPSGKLKPANLLSNAQGKQALVLGEGSTVSGDLMARGGIEVDRSAQVKGLVRPNQEERELPQWRTDDYDPKLLGRPYSELDATYSAPDPATPVQFTGTVRRQGNLSIEGNLNVEGALLFVDGDLTVNGALLGKGVVVATGNLTVRDHAEVDASDKVALLAKKKMTLKGEGRSSSLITGILYSEGGFEATQLTLKGVVISRQGRSAEDPVTFNGARVIKDPQVVSVEVAPTEVSAGRFSLVLVGGSSKEVYLEDVSLVRGGLTPPVPVSIDGPSANQPLVADFEVHAGSPTTYSVTFRPHDAVPPIEGHYTLEDMCAKLNGVTDISTTELLRMFQTVARNGVPATRPTVSPGYTLTVNEPSQLLPFYQQARIVLWKEESALSSARSEGQPPAGVRTTPDATRRGTQTQE